MKETQELQVLESIRERMEQLPGHLGFYYKNLVSGFEYGVRAEESYLAASVIKLPLYLHILARSATGTLDMREKLLVNEEDKVPICGALTLFTGPIEVDIRTLCRLIISLSDNTATNRLIDYCGVEETQKAFREMGLDKTVLRRKMFDREKSLAGIQNHICPKEMAFLLEQLYRGEFVKPDLCREALELLLLQQIDHKLNGKLCNVVPVAHKTGEDDNLSNDVGIVYAPKPFIVCYAGHDTDVYRWEDLMRQATYELYAIQ
ncbi:MAG: serine hydrolase [Oscillospiraceae bacterium]|nr:serine hydrolase [Oscillospiraceae bacterium]